MINGVLYDQTYGSKKITQKENYYLFLITNKELINEAMQSEKFLREKKEIEDAQRAKKQKRLAEEKRIAEEKIANAWKKHNEESLKRAKTILNRQKQLFENIMIKGRRGWKKNKNFDISFKNLDYEMDKRSIISGKKQASIAVKVVDKETMPIINALVTLFNTKDEIILQNLTNRRGIASLYNFTYPNEYYFTIFHPNYGIYLTSINPSDNSEQLAYIETKWESTTTNAVTLNLCMSMSNVRTFNDALDPYNLFGREKCDPVMLKLQTRTATLNQLKRQLSGPKSSFINARKR